MKRVSLYVDYDTIHESLGQGPAALTPSLFMQRVTSAAHVMGSAGSTWIHADWSQHPVWIRDSFEAGGWRCGESLGSPEGWQALKQEVVRDSTVARDLTVVLVTGSRALASRSTELRPMGSELVLWMGKDQGFSPTGWDRVDSLIRILDLGEDGLSVVVDVQGLVASSWDPQGSVDVDSLLERLETAMSRFGTVSSRTALADWHTLPVLRNKAGDPLTHEAELVFRQAGYSTPAVPPMEGGQPLPDEVTAGLERQGYARSIVIIGRPQIAMALALLLEPKAGELHLWCDQRPDTPPWIAWCPLGEMLQSPAPPSVPAFRTGSEPGLWARVALFTDRAIAEVGGESISEHALVSALTLGSHFTRKPEQALALISMAISRGTLLEVEDGPRGERRFRINEEDPELCLMRDLLKALLDILGDGPGDGAGTPVSAVLDGLLARHELSGRSQDRRSLQAWLSFLVDEGILIRFQRSIPESDELAACLAFSPPPVKGADVPEVHVARDRGRERPPKPAPVRIPSGMREHLIVTIDNYAVRHGKQAAPLSALRRSLAEYGGQALDAAVREGARAGDLQVSKSGPPSLTLNRQSKFVRLIVSRKNRAISLLKRMAPMGQPIGEARIKGALSESLKVRDNEIGEWIGLLLKERLLRREPQIMTSGGPSYTLALEDPAVVRAHEQAMARDPGDGFRGEPRRVPGRGKGRGRRPRERRRP